MLTRGSFFEDVLSGWFGEAPMDVREDAGGFEIEVDLPGVEAGDIDIRVSEGELSIKASRKWSKTEGKASFCRTFSKAFILPETVDSNVISATYKQGVLRVVVPKKIGAPVRKIEVETQ